MPSTPTPTATVREDADGVSVEVVWGGVKLDRPSVGGYGFPATKTGRSVAARLARAINDGAWYGTPEVKVDRGGETYVHARGRTMAKYANSELRRMGY